LLIAATVLLTWYAKLGVSNPFAVARSIRVSGDRSGYAVAAVAAEFRKDTVAVGEVAVSGGALGYPPSADSSGAAVWKVVYPFADSVRAVLLTYGGMTAMICDTAIFAKRRGRAAAPQFYEKLDILVVPSSSVEALLGARNRFRPRFIAAAPPCTGAPARNILCAQPNETGQWSRVFNLNGQKLEVSGDRQR